MAGTRKLIVALGLTALASCAAPSPASTPTMPPPPTTSPTNDATAVVRLSGREVQLRGGNCTWFEAEGKLVVEIGPSSAGDYLKLAAPLAWTGEVLPPGAVSADPSLEVTLGGRPLVVDQAGIIGSLASDAGFGSYEAQTTEGAPVTGEFDCPTVVDG